MTPTTLLAASGDWGRGDMMDGNSNGWHSAWMALGFVIVVALLAVLVVVIVRQSRPPAPPAGSRPATESAHRILAERLAHGEITPEEYRERLRTLEGSSPPA